MENEVLFNKIDKMFKELEMNIGVLRETTNQISQNLYKLDCACTRIEDLKEKFNKIKDEK